MKPLREALFNKKNLNNGNKYGISEKDMINDISGFPVGMVVRMMEEQEKQGNKPNVTIFQYASDYGAPGGGFDWNLTEDGEDFWGTVIPLQEQSYQEKQRCFKIFFKKHPEYEKYNN